MSNPLYYTMRFLDGLHFGIKSMVTVQHPKDLDTSFVLAQLQEEIVDTSRLREYKKLESSALGKHYSHGPLPLPPPPSKATGTTAKTSNRRSRMRSKFLKVAIASHRPMLIVKPKVYAISVGCHFIKVMNAQIQFSYILWNTYGITFSFLLMTLRRYLHNQRNSIVCTGFL